MVVGLIGADIKFEFIDHNTDLQPKTGIDEISLLWLFCGCWTRIWY